MDDLMFLSSICTFTVIIVTRIFFCEYLGSSLRLYIHPLYQGTCTLTLTKTIAQYTVHKVTNLNKECLCFNNKHTTFPKKSFHSKLCWILFLDSCMSCLIELYKTDWKLLFNTFCIECTIIRLLSMCGCHTQYLHRSRTR